MSDQPQELPAEPQPGDEANDNGGPTWQQERFDQTYPNAQMTAEDRPDVPDGGVEAQPEGQPESQSLADVTVPPEQPVEG